MARYRTAAEPGAISEINTTPLIDVMLVLLIVFMLITPVASRSIDSRFPSRRRTTSSPSLASRR